MRRPWITIVIILLGMTSILCLTSSRGREPLYGSKTVTQWLDAGYEDCATALQEIGPPALPFILTSFGRTEQPAAFVPGWTRISSAFRNLFQKAPACNLDENRVCSLTLELGPRTIPMLAQELENRHANVRAVSARSLSIWRDQGKDIHVAIRQLKQALNDPSPAVRTWAARALHSDARPAGESTGTSASRE
jgi:hypothetical protein